MLEGGGGLGGGGGQSGDHRIIKHSGSAHETSECILTFDISVKLLEGLFPN